MNLAQILQTGLNGGTLPPVYNGQPMPWWLPPVKRHPSSVVKFGRAPIPDWLQEFGAQWYYLGTGFTGYGGGESGGGGNGGGDPQGVCNCITGTPYRDVNGNCSCCPNGSHVVGNTCVVNAHNPTCSQGYMLVGDSCIANVAINPDPNVFNPNHIEAGPFDSIIQTVKDNPMVSLAAGGLLLFAVFGGKRK